MSPLHLAHGRNSAPRLPVTQDQTHKVNPDEILLASWSSTGPDTFTVDARWPQHHDFYTPRHGLHDPLMLVETIRQTLPLLAHAAYDVPAGHQLLWHDVRWNLVPTALRVEGSPAEVELHISCTDIKYRRCVPATMVLHAQVARAGLPLAHARTRFAIQDRAVYRRMRGVYADIAAATAMAVTPEEPVAPSTVRRVRERDVVLSPTGSPGRWLLRVDVTHPVLFDHPVDHVPGMLLLEASRQAAQAVAPEAGPVIGMETVFIRYAELDAPCRLSAVPCDRDPMGNPQVLVTAHQRDEEVFTTTVTLARPQSS
ncbi:ScbA/BarX family gamma-butyrolactone biosynthesis protein [Streptomyces sp. NPDC095613]|uniref:ScbA/BarX family gamma-butyrolactone biosynthesis protein n=1 Tax=Streptomyces sp. NPDC095613 TaxID=3155540 RepID=UPI00331EE83C